MVTFSVDTWAKWLNNHETYATYNALPKEVTQLCDSADAVANFDKLSKAKNLVMLTKAPMGGKCQATFLHSTVGTPLVPKDLHYVARVGMKNGMGMEVDPASIFLSTAGKYKPDLLEMMKISSAAEFGNLKANTNENKKKFKSFCVLTPILAHTIQKTDMTYANIMVAVVEHLKLSIPQPTAADAAAAPQETEDEILLKMAEPYESILYFLWSCQHLEKEIKVPTMVALQDDDTLKWDETTRAQFITPPKPTTIDLSSTMKTSDLSSGAIAAMTKLSDSMIKHQEAAIKAQEEKSDSRIKAWRRLPQIQQNVILLAGVEEDGTVPKEPTEEMLSILGCQNGAQVDQFLKQSMQGYNMSLEPGFCTALNKGMIVCPDDVGTPTNFTAFLTPPVNDDDEDEDNANLLKLAVQEKYDSKDLILLTKMDISIPMKTSDLKHQMKNISGIAGRIMGEDAMVHTSLLQVSNHIEKKETSYNYEFKQDKLFGGNFMDRVNWRMHRFFDSCASGDVSIIDTDKLDFSDMLEQVERREYVAKSPAWIRKLLKKKEKKNEDGDGYEGRNRGGGGGGRGTNRERGDRDKRRQFGSNNDRGTRIPNANTQDGCTLEPTEMFRDVFHPGNVRFLVKPKLKTGTEMCLRFHALGFCFRDCKHKEGHGTLDADETALLKTYVEGARSSRRNFQNGRNRNGNDQRNGSGGQPQQRQPQAGTPNANRDAENNGESRRGHP